jgi:hypothetical protein
MSTALAALNLSCWRPALSGSVFGLCLELGDDGMKGATYRGG